MTGETRWITEQDVAGTLSLGAAVDALRIGFCQEGAGRAEAMEKTMLAFAAGAGHGTLHALGAVFGDDGIVGTKTWAHTPGGADPALLLFDAGTGVLRAVIEAFALGQLRTAGTAALATDLLARPDASRLALIGTGRQALAQVAAAVHVRPIETVAVYSRDAERRQAFARRVSDELGVAAVATGSAAEAVEGAGVVTLVSRATAPVLTARMVEPGVHINALGAIDLERREFEPSILARCAAVVTDSRPQARNLSSELREHYGDDAGAWASVRTLGEMVAAGGVERPSGGVTLFKGMGSGVEDLALGVAVLRRFEHDGAELIIKRDGRARVDLTTRASTTRHEMGMEP
jgi:alanine dehydrogenase